MKGAHQPIDQGSPRWSPDDRLIVFDARSDDGRRHVYVTDAAGGPARPITSGQFTEERPSWSADGQWLYFNSNRTGQLQIYRTPARGGNVEQLTQNGGAAPMESADGTTLYYFRFSDEGRTLFARSIGGTERRIDRVVAWNYWPAPKGLYYVRPSATGAPNIFEVQFLDSASGKSSTMFRLQAEGVTAGLTVSRDGKTVLVAGVKDADSDLWLIENYR